MSRSTDSKGLKSSFWRNERARRGILIAPSFSGVEILLPLLARNVGFGPKIRTSFRQPPRFRVLRRVGPRAVNCFHNCGMVARKVLRVQGQYLGEETEKYA